ncbi:MAG: aminotransferase class V-fold PLP-dependent enzyme, partial [Saprospiraceae bacterium]|nr:aminotransferase class V-fold PLP-dependent enzyme [Saprospiraceae bacterium]
VDPDSVRICIERHRPKLVSVSHIPTNSGLIQDVAAVGLICRERDVVYLVDACQSVGQMPVDVSEIQCDFLSATFRKFLRGPRGAGFLFVSDRALDLGLEPLMIDMQGARWVSRDMYTPVAGARRFEEWEHNYALMMGAHAACQYALDVGIERICRRIFRMARVLREGLSRLPGARVLDKGSRQCAITTSFYQGVMASALQARLTGINVGLSLDEYAVIDFREKEVPWALRASPHYYNTDGEIHLLLDRLQGALTA